jgi:hypothetical protein
VYKFNLARSVIQVERLDKVPGHLDLRLQQTKFNFGQRSEDIGLRLTFGEHAVRMTMLTKVEPSFHGTLSAEDKLLLSLANDGQATSDILAQRTGVDNGTVRNTVSKLHGTGRVREASKVGHATIWALTGGGLPCVLAREDGVRVDELVEMSVI